jgi:hypothetical protein
LLSIHRRRLDIQVGDRSRRYRRRGVDCLERFEGSSWLDGRFDRWFNGRFCGRRHVRPMAWLFLFKCVGKFGSRRGELQARSRVFVIVLCGESRRGSVGLVSRDQRDGRRAAKGSLLFVEDPVRCRLLGVVSLFGREQWDRVKLNPGRICSVGVVVMLTFGNLGSHSG